MLVASFTVLLAAPLFATQDMFVSNYFLYRDENDTINEAFSFRLEKRVVERTKLKIAYLHANIKYYKVPMWNERLRRRLWSHGDQYSLQVEQKTFGDAKLTLGWVYTENTVTLTDAYLKHEMEEKLGKRRKPISSSYSISYSQPFRDQNTVVEVGFVHIDSRLVPYWEYDLAEMQFKKTRTTSYTNSLSLTVTQILTKYTSCQFVASYATQSDIPALWSFSANLHQYIPTRTSLQVYYRYSEDGDRFRSDTCDVKVYQYITDDIIVMARVRSHKEHDASLSEERERELRDRQEFSGDLSVSLLPINSMTSGCALIVDLLGIAGAPQWLGASFLDKINLDLRFNHYRTNRGIKSDMFLAGLAFLF